jgi:putative peptidoglycan lipid II flippase
VLLALIASGADPGSGTGVVLAWSIVASGVLQVLVLVGAAARLGMSPPPMRPRLTPEMRHLLQLATPGLIGGGVTQLTGVVSLIIATLQGRVVSWLYYADRIFQLPLGVVGVAIAVVLLPNLSHKLRAGDRAGVIDSENRGLEFALLLTLPAAAALVIAAEPIVGVLFERGAFTAADTQATSRMLAALALGLPAYVLIKVLHPSFFAREDTKTPMLLAAISLLVNGGLGFALFRLIGPTSIALAASFSGWLKLGLLAGVLARRGEFVLDAAFRRAFAGMVAATAIMSGVVFGLTLWLEPSFGPANSLVTRVAALVVLVACGLAAYLAAAQWLGAMKIRAIAQELRR